MFEAIIEDSDPTLGILLSSQKIRKERSPPELPHRFQEIDASFLNLFTDFCYILGYNSLLN